MGKRAHGGSSGDKKKGSSRKEKGPADVREAGSLIAAAMLEAADPRTGEHSDDVELVVAEICRRLDLASDVCEDVIVAARLHDVGKVAIPREVLEKKGVLTDAEWELIKEHTVTGERILKTIPELGTAAKLVRHSHEHYDGTGYPDGLKGKRIPLGSRIILCADAFHAIRSDRPYRKGRSTPAAVKEIKRCAGTQFDPEVVDALAASIKSAKSSRRRRMPPKLAVLFAVLAIGGGGAYAAERGWIPSPIPGLGPDRATEGPEGGPGFDTSSAETGTAEGTALTPAGAETAGNPIPGAVGAGADAGAERRGGDHGVISASAVLGADHVGGGGSHGGESGPGAGTPGDSAGAGGGFAGGDAGGGGSTAGPGGGAGAGGSTGGGSTGGGNGAAGSSAGGSAGNSASAPGQTGSTPGQSGSTPGQSGNNPSGGGAPPGQSASSPGLSGSAPGLSGTAPGLGGSNPASGAIPPGQSAIPPGNSGNAPGHGGVGGNPHA